MCCKETDHGNSNACIKKPDNNPNVPPNGECKNEKDCETKPLSNLCPGPIYWKCCVPTTTTTTSTTTTLPPGQCTFLSQFQKKCGCGKKCQDYLNSINTYSGSLDTTLIAALIWQESHCNAYAVGPDDSNDDDNDHSNDEFSYGLMQVHQSHCGDTPSPACINNLMADSDLNIQLGIGILKSCLTYCNGNVAKALTCYNRGPGKKDPRTGSYSNCFVSTFSSNVNTKKNNLAC